MSIEQGVVSRNVARVWAVLLPAGAWDVAPVEFDTMGARWASVFLVYKEGAQAGGGAVDVRPEVCPHWPDRTTGAAQDWYMLPVEALSAVVAGADSDSDVQRLSHITYEAVAADEESILLTSLEIARGVERMRLSCRESGVVGTPGRAELIVMLSDTNRTEFS